MADSLRYQVPYMEAAQSQKHVTHNDAVRVFDQVLNAEALDKDLATPPGSPANGDGYIIAAAATGAWAGKDDHFTAYIDGSWLFVAPVSGFRVYVADESLYYRYNGSAWVQEPNSILGNTKRLAQDTNGSFLDVYTVEELLSGLSGASVDCVAGGIIPTRAIVLGVSTRTVTAITGATSYDCGDGTTADRFGGTLSIAANATNVGVIGPTAIYSPMTIRLTANGGNFTGGAVRVATHYILPGAPTS